MGQLTFPNAARVYVDIALWGNSDPRLLKEVGDLNPGNMRSRCRGKGRLVY